MACPEGLSLPDGVSRSLSCGGVVTGPMSRWGTEASFVPGFLLLLVGTASMLGWGGSVGVSLGARTEPR